tara:strand:- start:5643 stop:6218 length:576 start_codon:yes stop_codon:yes gene_type:complete
MGHKDLLIDTISDFKKVEGGTVAIHGKNYSTVATRVAVARRNLGTHLSIQTSIIDKDADTVTVKAKVFIDGRLIATGIAEENRKASRINQTSAVENCETSAIGRALAFSGLQDNNIASAEEVSAAIEQQDQKVKQLLKDLEAISHAGNYQEWLTKNKGYLAILKKENPLTYSKFQERYTEIKSKLKSNGAI